jgi:arylformamidase
MPEKGPPVYLDYDQAALDAAYDQAAYAPNREQLIKRRIRDSELTRLRIGQPERVAYGPADIAAIIAGPAGGIGSPGAAWKVDS